MVDKNRFLRENSIDALEIICKECTRKLDREGEGRSKHAIWELHWVKSNLLHLLAVVLNDLSKGDHWKWSEQAVNDFWKLGTLAFPEQAKDPISIE
jgi:hypothetical protein